MTFRVRLTNHGFFVDGTFATIADAVKAAKNAYQIGIFDAKHGGLVASWCPIGGLRVYSETVRNALASAALITDEMSDRAIAALEQEADERRAYAQYERDYESRMTRGEE